MLAQISLLLSASLLWLACTIDPSAGVKEANDMTMERPWDEHTLEDPDKTITAKFVPHPESEKDKKEICVALEVGENSALHTAYKDMIAEHDKPANQRNSQLHNDFLDELSTAKILCISRYRDNRPKTKTEPEKEIILKMFSYFDGKDSHRVHCYSHDNKFQCRDGKGSEKYWINNRAPFLKDGKFKRVTDSILSMDKKERQDKYSQSRKILRVSSSWLTRKQKAFHPVLSRERAEYKYENVTNIGGHQQKDYMKVIANKDLVSAKTGERILPECIINEGSDGTPQVTGFKTVKECVDELTPWGRYCKFWSSSQEKYVSNAKQINACKLEGRGIIIKQANDELLRVSACEYQPASQHFYCSGKLETEDPSYKVYFERYGVDISEEQNPNCDDEQTLFTGRRGTGSNSWDKSTTDSPSSTFNNGFVRWGPTSKLTKKQHCFALDVESDGKLRTAWRKKIASDSTTSDSRNYLREVSLAKVLCISKYRYKNDTETKYMFSYYTGGSDGEDHRANCWKKGNDGFICKDEKGNTHTLISDADVKAQFDGKHIVRKIVAIEDYDESKKIMRVKGRHLANKQIARYPYVSEEMPEYDYRDLLVNNRDQRRYVKVIEAIKSSKNGQDILPMCENSDGSITGFKKISPCGTEFGIYGHFCGDNEDKVEICKLGGRGILIKEANDDILRVTACEHQPAAGHFYCSGRIDNDNAQNGELKVYFERYGVYTEKVDIQTVHSCPDTRTIVKKTSDNRGGSTPDVPIVVEEESSTTSVGGVGTVTETIPDCQPDTAIDNCTCNLLTHAGRCLRDCPPGYTEDGTGCKQNDGTTGTTAVADPPVMPPPAVTPPAVTPPVMDTPVMDTPKPDCTDGMRTADCNSCDSPMHVSGGLCCDAGKHADSGVCVVTPDCSHGQYITNCTCRLNAIGGLCCNAGEIAAGGICKLRTPSCADGASTATNNCVCDNDRKTSSEGNCVTECPDGENDNDDNGSCVADPVRCSLGDSLDHCDVCEGEKVPSTTTGALHCCGGGDIAYHDNNCTSSPAGD